jgi:hypothetical protein
MRPTTPGILAAGALVGAFVLTTPAPVRAQAPCVIEIRLAGIACEQASDAPDAESPRDPRGEYYVRLIGDAEVGPFELRAGESSSFRPGLLLRTVDTGVAGGPEAPETTIPLAFDLSVREDDSSPAGEDETDDHSRALQVRGQVGCPASSTHLVRRISVPGDTTAAGRSRADQLKLTLLVQTTP